MKALLETNTPNGIVNKGRCSYIQENLGGVRIYPRAYKQTDKTKQKYGVPQRIHNISK
ncbi:MAG: hypothetical protein IKU32_08175 [Clostridia bacterium]|nr:hypothetical protein [Clostridia bacterium]